MSEDEKPVGRASDKFMLRFPDGMRDQIAAAAKESGRSMNAEIVHRLSRSFGGALDADEPEKTVMALMYQLASTADKMGLTFKIEIHAQDKDLPPMESDN